MEPIKELKEEDFIDDTTYESSSQEPGRSYIYSFLEMLTSH
jgi:hypothetical protein